MSDQPAALAADADLAEVLATLGRRGALTELYPQAGDGRLDPVRLRKLLAEADRTVRPGVVLGLLVHLATALPLLADSAAGNPGQLSTGVLAGALAGAAPLALAATDAGPGSDLTALATTVRIQDGDPALELTGSKRWVTSLLAAEYALVLARHRPGRHFTSFCWVLVPVGAAGITVRPAGTALFDGSAVGHLELDRVVLDRVHLLGRPGRGLATFARQMAVERLGSAGWGIELCRRAVAETAALLADRQIESGPLLHAPVIRQRLADCAVRLSALDALWTHSARRIAEERDATAAAVLKAASADVVERVVTTCAQLQGADGFRTGGIQELRATAAVFGIGGGTTEVVLDTVADRLDTVLAGLAARSPAKAS